MCVKVGTEGRGTFVHTVVLSGLEWTHHSDVGMQSGGVRLQ